MKRPMGSIVPLSNVAFSVRSPRPSAVRSLRTGKGIPFRHSRGRVRFRVPELRDYEVIVVSKEVR